jgi:hypothetical protein
MAEPRIPERAGFVDAAKLPTGPNGFPLCRKCGEETPGKRRTFCSDACVHEWKLTTQPAYQRRHVEKRDSCVCQSCGIDTKEQRAAIVRDLRERLDAAGWLLPHDHLQLLVLVGPRIAVDREVLPRTPGQSWPEYIIAYPPEELLEPTLVELKRLRIPWRRFVAGPAWDMDHIVPVAEGGGGCGLDNLRTLCRLCHVRVTTELRKRLREKAKLDG